MAVERCFSFVWREKLTLGFGLSLHMLYNDTTRTIEPIHLAEKARFISPFQCSHEMERRDLLRSGTAPRPLLDHHRPHGRFCPVGQQCRRSTLLLTADIFSFLLSIAADNLLWNVVFFCLSTTAAPSMIVQDRISLFFLESQQNTWAAPMVLPPVARR
jgi:hypothetical protein